MSANSALADLAPEVRDKAGLLGCQFRMVPKAELVDTDGLISKLYDLVVSWPDALRINGLITAWGDALERAKSQFAASVRTLDLADYASVHDLTLKAEGERLGDYVLDLYEIHMHSLLESQEGVIRAAKELNKIDLQKYPPAHLAPSEQLVALVDSAIFRSQAFTDVLGAIDGDPTDVQLGDVFLSPRSTHAPAGEAEGTSLSDDQPEMPSGDRNPEYAYVVLSQSCDLEHGEADRLLLLRGKVQPYSWKYHERKPASTRTPVMYAGEDRYSIDWDVLSPETWLLSDLKQRLEGGYRRIRRFRMPFALQLQQKFIGNLGRVGTMVTPPALHVCMVKIFLRRNDNTAIDIAATRKGDAVCLVGRDKDNIRYEKLLLSEEFVATFRRGLRNISAADLLPADARKLESARNNPAFYRALKCGLELNRESEKGCKPFRDVQEFDVLQIFTRQVITQEAPAMDRSWKPLVMEVDAE